MGVSAGVERFLILVDDELRADLPGIGVAKLDHLGEFVTGVHVQERKRDLSRIEGLLRQAQHDRGVFTDGIEHHRAREFGSCFPENVNTLGLQRSKVIEPRGRGRHRFDRLAGFEFRPGEQSFRCVGHERSLKQKTHLPEFLAVGSLQSWSRELFRKLASKPNKTRRPSPLGADNNKRRSFGRKSFRLSGYLETSGLTNHLFGLMASTISMLAAHARLRRRPAHNQLLRRGRWNQGSHLADHRQYQPLVSIRERGTVLFDLREEANFVLRELSKRFLSFTVAWRFGAGEK